LAAGKDQEVGEGSDISFLGLGDRPVLAWSLKTIEECTLVEGVVLVVQKGRIDNILRLCRTFGFSKVASLVASGSGRRSNLKKAYDQVPERCKSILIHEASRPFVSPETIQETIKAGKRYGAAIAAVKSSDAVKLAEKGQKISKALDRNTVWLAQTPQVYKRPVLEKILNSWGPILDDESEFLKASRQDIHLVVSDEKNLKIRSADDLNMAAALAELSNLR
jgi:2-C-methyl-D-erythritol 4-phosphate cytidylyltransferase